MDVHPKLQTGKVGVGYCRVSTDMQVKKEYSIEDQQGRILDYIRYAKLEFKEIYKDPGLSGKNMVRKDLQRLLADMGPGWVIVITSISRISRSVKDTLEIIERIKAVGASLVILDFNVDTSNASGEMMLVIMAGVAQMERKQISERVTAAMNAKRLDGTLRTKPHYGYKVTKLENGASISEPVEAEQIVIRFIRSLITEQPNIGVAQIVRALIENRYKTRKGTDFYYTVVRDIIAYEHMR